VSECVPGVEVTSGLTYLSKETKTLEVYWRVGLAPPDLWAPRLNNDVVQIEGRSGDDMRWSISPPPISPTPFYSCAVVTAYCVHCPRWTGWGRSLFLRPFPALNASSRSLQNIMRGGTVGFIRYSADMHIISKQIFGHMFSGFIAKWDYTHRPSVPSVLVANVEVVLL